MKRLGSLRFDGALGPERRDAVATALSSAGIAVASWTQARSAPRTYASLELPPEAAPDAASRGGAARFDEPALVVLEIAPNAPSRLAALGAALGGPGAPAGVLDVVAGESSVLVEMDPRASLRLLLDVVDSEFGAWPARTVTPLLPLSDASLAALASATLAIPDLDARRLIETFSEPLLAERVG